MRMLLSLILVCLALQAHAQLIIQPSATESIFVDLAEQGEDFILVTTAEVEVNLIYHQRIYRLDHALNVILDSVNIDYTDHIQFPDIAFGNLVKRDGNVEYVGIAGHLTAFSPEPFTTDSSVFIRLAIEENLQDFTMEKVGLLNGYLTSKDFIYDEQNGRYVGSAYESFPTYRVLSVDTALSEGRISESIYRPPVVDWNFYLLTKVMIPPSGSDIYVLYASSIYDVFNADLEFQGNSFPPFPDPTYHIMMSQSMELYENRIYCMTPENVGQMLSVSTYTFPWSNGSRFTIEFSDSTSTGSVFRGLDLNEEQDLLLGVHLKADDEDYAKALKVIKCDTLGNILWQKTLSEGLDVRYVFKKILATSDGGAVIAAERFSDPLSDDPDGIILYRLDGNGLVVGLQESKPTLPVITIYPNPVLDKLYIRNASPQASYRLMDLRGAVLKEGALDTGSIDLTDFPVGLYLIEIVDGGNSLIEKVLKAE